MEDGEERAAGSSSWRRGSLADGAISTPRWKWRAPGAPPMEVAASPGRHDVVVPALPRWRWIHLHGFVLLRDVHLHGLDAALRWIDIHRLRFAAAPLKPPLLRWRRIHPPPRGTTKKVEREFVNCSLCHKGANKSRVYYGLMFCCQGPRIYSGCQGGGL